MRINEAAFGVNIGDRLFVGQQRDCAPNFTIKVTVRVSCLYKQNVHSHNKQWVGCDL